MADKPVISGLILAGGAGRRVQGQDKGLLEWRGAPLVAHVASRLRPQVDELLLSCNRNAERYAPYADSVITDLRPEFQGPLAGIEAAAKVIESEYLVVVACDTPLLPTDLVARLMAPLICGEAQISFARDDSREQYLFAAMQVACLDSLGPYLESGQRAVRHWYQLFQTVGVDFSEQSNCFKNFNRTEYFDA